MPIDTPQAVEPVQGSDAPVSDPSEDIKEQDVPVETDAPEEGEEEQETADTTEDEQEADDTKESKAIKSMEKRIHRLTAKSSAAERRAQELEERLTQYEQGKSEELKEPNRDDFDTQEDYENALRDYGVEKGKLEAKAEKEKEQRETEFKERMQQTKATWDKAEAEFRKQNPDYDNVIEDLNASLSVADKKSPTFAAFRDALFATDDGPALGYHLAQNPEKLDDILEMPPHKCLIEVGKILSSLSAVQKPQPKPKPKPPSGVKAKGNTNKKPDDMTIDEFMDWRNKQTA